MKSDILLIHPPLSYDTEKHISFYKNSYVGYGMLSIAAFLRENGYSVKILHVPLLLQERKSCHTEMVKDYIRRADPSLVGIEMNWMQYSLGAVQTANIVKSLNPDLPVVIGGTHANLFAEEIVKNYDVDAVARGEAEIAMLKIAENVEKWAEKDIRGIVTKRGGKIVETPETVIRNIDDIPHYDYEGIEPRWLPTKSMSIYQSGRGESEEIIRSALNTCRGVCRHNCTYCVACRDSRLWNRQFTHHSPDWIVEQMKILLEKYNVDFFTIQDPIYCSSKNFFSQLCGNIVKEGLNSQVEIDVNFLPGTVGGQTLKHLSRAGVSRVWLGLESGSDKVLKLNNRPLNTRKMLDFIKMVKGAGIVPMSSFMTGLPGETQKDIEETISFAKKTVKSGCLPRYISPVTFFPKTLAYTFPEKYGIELCMKNFEDYFSYYGRKDYLEMITHKTRHMSEADIINAALRIKNILADLTTPELFKKAARSIEHHTKMHGILESYAENIEDYRDIIRFHNIF